MRSSDDNEEPLASRSNSGRNIAVHSVIDASSRYEAIRRILVKYRFKRRLFISPPLREKIVPRSFVNNRLACETSKVNISTNEDSTACFVSLISNIRRKLISRHRLFGFGRLIIMVCRFERLNLKKKKEKNKFQVKSSIKEGDFDEKMLCVVKMLLHLPNKRQEQWGHI